MVEFDFPFADAQAAGEFFFGEELVRFGGFGGLARGVIPASEMFNQMGHGLDSFFSEMKSRDAMDLKLRNGKAGGDFYDFLHQYEFPFIISNFNGTRGDVDVFTHEIGHALQSYHSQNQPMSDIVWLTIEACEIHSMALEFLT